MWTDALAHVRVRLLCLHVVLYNNNDNNNRLIIKKGKQRDKNTRRCAHTRAMRDRMRNKNKTFNDRVLHVSVWVCGCGPFAFAGNLWVMRVCDVHMLCMWLEASTALHTSSLTFVFTFAVFFLPEALSPPLALTFSLSHPLRRYAFLRCSVVVRRGIFGGQMESASVPHLLRIATKSFTKIFVCRSIRSFCVFRQSASCPAATVTSRSIRPPIARFSLATHTHTHFSSSFFIFYVGRSRRKFCVGQKYLSFLAVEEKKI